MAKNAAKRWGVVLDLPGAPSIFHRVDGWPWGELHPTIARPLDELGVDRPVVEVWIAEHTPAKTTRILHAPPDDEFGRPPARPREEHVDAVCPVRLVEIDAPAGDEKANSDPDPA